MTPLPPPSLPIPPGVRWSPSAANFYDVETDAGLGNLFFARWYYRRREFPVAHEFTPTSPVQEGGSDA